MLNSVKLSNSINIAIEAIIANKTRALLTGLGIMFGVAAVITMLAIGNGAKEEILAQSKLVGANNIVIKPKKEAQREGGDTEEAQTAASREAHKFSPGLRFEDAQSIAQVVPTVVRTSPSIEVNAEVMIADKMGEAKLFAINNDYFEIANLKVEKGSYFSDDQLEKGLPVCIIGKSIEKNLFGGENPLGRYLKAKGKWLQVIGIAEEKLITEKAEEELGIRNYNNDIYLPLKTYLLQIENRSQLRAASRNGTSNNRPNERKTIHELDELIVQVDETENLSASAGVIRRLLIRRHNGNEDFELSIPQHLIQQQQKTKEIFNLVLGVIAGISLLVGGIGIMNIMMASVTERTKEIGIRRAIGATGKDVTLQFILEAVIISLCGGILGILLGLSGSAVVHKLADIQTITTISSIILSFGVSVGVGLIFGISPAKKAAEQNPIEALRYE